MARAPRSPLHDQVTAQAIMARLDGFDDRLADVSKDTREARDATIALNARLTAENTSEQMAKIWTRIETADLQHRADLQNSYERLGTAWAKRWEDFAAGMAKREEDLNEDRAAWKARVESLEAWRNNREGARGLLGWCIRQAPWLVTIIIAALSVLRSKAH